MKSLFAPESIYTEAPDAVWEIFATLMKENWDGKTTKVRIDTFKKRVIDELNLRGEEFNSKWTGIMVSDAIEIGWNVSEDKGYLIFVPAGGRAPRS